MALVVAVMPFRLKRLLLRAGGHNIDRSAYIGISIVLVDRLVMGPGSRIDHFVFCKGLSELVMGPEARIGRFNWITAVPPSDERFYLHQRDRRSALLLGEHSAVTARHLIDCTNLVTIGKFSTLAGYHSQVLTHSVDLTEGRQDSAPITVGDYCFVGTDCVLLGGASLPSYSVLGAKSLLNKAWTEECQLYGGVPARPVKAIPRTWKYFERQVGVVY